LLKVKFAVITTYFLFSLKSCIIGWTT